MPSRRVLVVDDNPGAAQVLALTLSKFWGHDVQTAHAGAAALQVAVCHRPELMLVDIGLPDISGYEVAQRLRAKPDFAGTLLVALTGYDDVEDRRRSEEAGFDVHLVKPASVAVLQELFSHPKLTSS
jgi:two-component system CheB/CheR fusion protein